MRVVSSAELCSNMKQHLVAAKKETVIIRRGKNETFVLTRRDDLPKDFDKGLIIVS